MLPPRAKRSLKIGAVAFVLNTAASSWAIHTIHQRQRRMKAVYEEMDQCRRVGLMTPVGDVLASMGKPEREEPIAGLYGPGKRLWYRYSFNDDGKVQPYFEIDDRTQISVALDCRDPGRKSRRMVIAPPERFALLPAAGVIKSSTRY